MNKKRDQKQIHQNKPIGQILLRVGNHPSPLLLRIWIQDYSVVQRQLTREIDFFISFEKRFITLKRGLKDLLTSCYLLAREYYLLSPRLWRRTRERPRGQGQMGYDNCKGKNSIIFLCSTRAGLCVPAFSLVFTNRGLRIGSPPKRAGLVIFLSRGEGAWVTQGILPRKTKIPKCIVGSMSQSKKNMADQISL